MPAQAAADMELVFRGGLFMGVNCSSGTLPISIHGSWGDGEEEMYPAHIVISSTSTTDYCIILNAFCFALPWPEDFNLKLNQLHKYWLANIFEGI